MPPRISCRNWLRCRSAPQARVRACCSWRSMARTPGILPVQWLVFPQRHVPGAGETSRPAPHHILRADRRAPRGRAPACSAAATACGQLGIRHAFDLDGRCRQEPRLGSAGRSQARLRRGAGHWTACRGRARARRTAACRLRGFGLVLVVRGLQSVGCSARFRRAVPPPAHQSLPRAQSGATCEPAASISSGRGDPEAGGVMRRS